MTTLAPTAPLPTPKTRTNGRTGAETQLSLVRATFRVLSLSPRLAAWAGEHLFLRPRRRRTPSWEAAALEGAARFDFVVPGDGLVRGFRFGDAGPAIALVHGWEGRGSQLADLGRALAAAGYRAYGFDMPAHGNRGEREAHLGRFAETLLAADRAVGGFSGVVAHSFGALSTAVSARFGLDPEAVVLVNPASSPRRVTAMFGRLLALPPDVVRAVQRRIERRVGLRMDALEEGLPYRPFRGRTLIVQDRDDDVVDPATIEGIAEDTEARVVWTAGLGHSRGLRAPRVHAAIRAHLDALVRPLSDWDAVLRADFEVPSLLADQAHPVVCAAAPRSARTLL